MAVQKMQCVTICALAQHRKQLLESIQRKSVIEIKDCNEIGLKKLNTAKSQGLFKKNADEAQKSLDILKKYTAKNESKVSSLRGKEALSVQVYYELVSQVDGIMQTIHKVIALDREITGLEAKIVDLDLQLEKLMPWRSLDVSVNFKGTKQTRAFIGSIEGEITLDAFSTFIEEYDLKVDDVYVEIVSSSKGVTCMFILCDVENEQRLNDALHGLNFSRPTYITMSVPSDRIEDVVDEINVLKNEICDKKSQMRSLLSQAKMIKFVIDYNKMRVDKYEKIEKLALTDHTFIITGFVPQKKVLYLTDFLEKKFDAFVVTEFLPEEEDPPILLQNNFFAAPAEVILEGYSLPGKGERDPTWVMAIFYYILYGLMLSDAGYGIIMTLCCTMMLIWFRDMEQSVKRMVKLLLFCGISTTICGFMFGSAFGDGVNIISSMVKGVDIDVVKPLWFSPEKDPLTMLAFSFGIGVVHIFTGLCLKFFQLIWQRRFVDAICDALFWMLLVGSGVVYMLTLPTVRIVLNIQFITIGEPVQRIMGYIVLFGAIGIVLTSGRLAKGWWKKILKGVYGLYGITGYLSDILSYSRLLALGLATGIIGKVFNQLALMLSGMIHIKVLAIVVFVLIFTIGHAINLGMNGLGAYVHANRLQFVEFFGKFYEGGGRKFSPFSTKTKYYNIKEEV